MLPRLLDSRQSQRFAHLYHAVSACPTVFDITVRRGSLISPKCRGDPYVPETGCGVCWCSGSRKNPVGCRELACAPQKGSCNTQFCVPVSRALFGEGLPNHAQPFNVDTRLGRGLRLILFHSASMALGLTAAHRVFPVASSVLNRGTVARAPYTLLVRGIRMSRGHGHSRKSAASLE
jgi:hypothetical protein